MVARLEGGEWYNYTRIFASTNYYNVYLRYGAMYTMQLRLDLVGPGPALINWASLTPRMRWAVQFALCAAPGCLRLANRQW